MSTNELKKLAIILILNNGSPRIAMFSEPFNFKDNCSLSCQPKEDNNVWQKTRTTGFVLSWLQVVRLDRWRWWPQLDLNQWPIDYESTALTNWAMGPNDEDVTIVQKRNSIRTSNISFLTTFSKSWGSSKFERWWPQLDLNLWPVRWRSRLSYKSSS